MTPIERDFAELVGKILGRRWFTQQQAKMKSDNKMAQGEHIVKRQRKQ